MPEAVGMQRYDGVDYLTLPQGDRPIVAALVNAVKEQQDEILSLRDEINKLRLGRRHGVKLAQTKNISTRK